jgi:hypothetical protein
MTHGNPRAPGPTTRSRFPHRPALQTSITCCRLPCGLCSGETEPTSLRIHLDLFQWLSQFVGIGRLFGTCHQAARGVQDRAISFDWSGAEGLVRPATPGHGEESRAEHEDQAHAVCVLWRRKAHFHNPLDHAHIPVEVGGMMRSRMRTQEMRVMGITCCESLAPFLDPGFLNALSPGPIPAGKREGSSPADRATGPDLASILRANEFSSSRKANNLLIC